MIDAAGLVVAPGFIDIHAHVLGALEKGDPVESFLRDGVTSAIDGNDGVSAWPIGDALARLRKARPSLNIGTFAGLSPVRKAVVGDKSTAASDEEIEQMRALVEQAMRQGAFGVTSGLEPCLYHWPGYFTSKEELTRILAPVARFGGIHSSHLRDEAAGLLKAVGEVIEIGERAGVTTHLTHFKTVGPGNRGNGAAVVRLVETARKRGVDVAFDQFPYGDNGIDLTQLLPPWSFERGKDRLLEHLRVAADRARIKQHVAAKIREHAGSTGKLYFRRCKEDPSVVGKTLVEAARAAGARADLAAQAELYLQKVERDDCVIDEAVVAEPDIVEVLRSPVTMVASDGGIGAHPKSYGTRARILGHYVRERGVLRLEEAVRRMTSLPAQRLRLWDRGVLRPGARADVVVFDPARIIDRATREQPTLHADGVRHLLINGKAVIGRLTAERPGEILLGPGHDAPTGVPAR